MTVRFPWKTASPIRVQSKPRSNNVRRLLLALFLFASAAVAQTQHAATLSWTQSTTAGVTANNVYRGTVSGGPYTLLTTTALPAATTYVDNSVTGGTTYYYVVTALIGASESAFSNQATAAIPATPNAPTSLTVVPK